MRGIAASRSDCGSGGSAVEEAGIRAKVRVSRVPARSVDKPCPPVPDPSSATASGATGRSWRGGRLLLGRVPHVVDAVAGLVARLGVLRPRVQRLALERPLLAAVVAGDDRPVAGGLGIARPPSTGASSSRRGRCRRSCRRHRGRTCRASCPWRRSACRRRRPWRASSAHRRRARRTAGRPRSAVSMLRTIVFLLAGWG